MAATTLYTGNATSGITPTFTVAPASRVSVTLKGVDTERGEPLNRVECVLLFAPENTPVMFGQLPISLHADSNAFELFHAGLYAFQYRNPEALTFTVTTE